MSERSLTSALDLRGAPMLFHVSEEDSIEQFVPRGSAYLADPVVWAIEERRLCNYLVPRDCPRVTFYAGPGARDLDVQQLLGASTAVVAIEDRWLERVRSTPLFCYRMPPATFACHDEEAGYFVSHAAVAPMDLVHIVEPIAELKRREVELRVLPSLWSLRDAVVASSMKYSLIRMRNAVPRQHAIAPG